MAVGTGRRRGCPAEIDAGSKRMGPVDPGCLEQKDVRKPVVDLAGKDVASGRQIGPVTLLYIGEGAVPPRGKILLGQQGILVQNPVPVVGGRDPSSHG